jgi:hypothetical protein
MNDHAEAEALRRAELDFLREEAKSVDGDLEQVYFDLLPYSKDPDGEGTQDPAAWDEWIGCFWRARGWTISSDFRDDSVVSPSGHPGRTVRRNGRNSEWIAIPEGEFLPLELSEVETMRILRTHIFSIYWRIDMTLSGLMEELAGPAQTADLPLWPDFRIAASAPVDPDDFAASST